KMEFNPEIIDLDKYIQDWNISFQAAARKKSIHFTFTTNSEDSYRMLGDPEKLERIYFNLLSNAFKFTPENGSIQVALNMADMGNGNRELTLIVSNTGSNISPEHVQNIFNRFYTLDRHHSGSGIGLALTKAFVELHGGTIRVQSDSETGTSFIICFSTSKSL
ncbi:MAG: HAMP domain-containing sensor histidine kinase, partial [Bacteroidales bacterium]